MVALPPLFPIVLGATMKLSTFIQNNHTQILQEWETFAGTLIPSLPLKLLRDHAEELLMAIVSDMEMTQSGNEQAEKSRGKGRAHKMRESGMWHASHRLETGFTLDQLVSEYRFLRASVLHQWQRVKGEDKEGVTRFNESIDEALMEAVKEYSDVTTKHRNELLGILGHDLRNPLGAIIMGATLLTNSETMNDKEIRIATRIVNSGKRIHRMIDYLLDLTRIKQGKSLPITTVMTDIEMLCRLVIAELTLTYPNRIITFSAEGDLHGRWDSDRMIQVISNLVANALQHSADEVKVRALEEKDHSVTVEVHNSGPPIPPLLMKTMFDRMITDETAMSSGLGLGLYIAREIVEAHKGCITVDSSHETGTTFMVRLPRESNSQRPSGCPPPLEPPTGPYSPT